MRNRLFNDSYFKKSIRRPYRTQTCDTKLRRLVLYPVELRVHKNVWDGKWCTSSAYSDSFCTHSNKRLGLVYIHRA